MTVPALTTLRYDLATAIADNSLWQVFAYPPATIQANSVIVQPDDPYLTPSNNSYSTVGPEANFKLLITVPLLDNQGNLQGMEEAITTLFRILDNSIYAYRVGNVSAPSILSVASGDLLSCEMAISIVTSWS